MFWEDDLNGEGDTPKERLFWGEENYGIFKNEITYNIDCRASEGHNHDYDEENPEDIYVTCVLWIVANFPLCSTFLWLAFTVKQTDVQVFCFLCRLFPLVMYMDGNIMMNC